MKSNRYFDDENNNLPLNKKLSFKNIKIEKLDEN
jgi:hypothetical protein